VQLRWPDVASLADYVKALERGWSPDNVRPEVAASQIEAARDDPVEFTRSLVDRSATQPPIRLPDGSMIERLPGFQKWMWDDGFVGAVYFRWKPGTSELPAEVLGHVGYTVVPWKRRRGYATQGLGLMLRDIAAERLGLPFVELTTDVENLPSQRVIEANGGVLVERFRMSQAYGGSDALRYRIPLPSS
jgi:predicted acetyltransferase